jgi:ribosomal protein L28
VDTKQKRFLCTVGFKLHAVGYAKEHGKRAHARCFSPNLEQWRKQEEITDIIE